ncbi:MAG TPA: ClbS/DfsB family four-helix bundle protein [Phycisphaerae bacterium]|nr:ClbS/DfsB family four-helix bundle protein [Phycisphaerae bacterium]
MDARDALLQRITSRMVRMREALERFNDMTAERMLVGDNWNVRDLVGHFVFWLNELADQVPRLAAGGMPKKYDVDRINDETYRRNRRMSFVMLWGQLRAAEERLLTAIRKLDLKLVMDDTPVRQAIEQIGVEHYDAHWRGLRQALEDLDDPPR